MIKFGPLILRDDYDNENETIRVFGPFTATGNVKVKSLSTFGPLTVIGKLTGEKVSANGPITARDDLLAVEVKVNGPLNISGNLTLQEGRINGPVNSNNRIEVAEYLTINGPLKAESVIAKNLMLNGQVRVTGTIEASEEIIIRVGSGTNQIQAELIKAPTVIIKPSVGSIFNRIFRLLSVKNRKLISSISVPIEAENLIISGVRYQGLLNDKNVVTNEFGEIMPLLDESE